MSRRKPIIFEFDTSADRLLTLKSVVIYCATFNLVVCLHIIQPRDAVTRMTEINDVRGMSAHFNYA